MRNLTELNEFRVPLPKVFGDESQYDKNRNGAFVIQSPIHNADALRILASAGAGWDHVSVSCEHRCPTWGEMEFVKRKFFEDDETTMQLHVPPKDHVNTHPYTLHLWRPRSKFNKIPMPPKNFV